ncbi:chalcone isomerase family protein [Candidatus Deferrimicrobium sp.]|uniref:chalcone isomerase family protein n=1 Tax=Candidatus Deferrimicrobium sp. TaxID=3060586 RepID=UPI00271910F9|nr:chalcone isomerase family protein [Candidatus Deferrimicrobium sp.]MDO8739665.1 chalcone isomerase family protein [Candidatus Deferrimicrobium sp.]
MRKLAVALSFLLLSSQAFALDVAGVNVAPTVSVHQKTLLLNGAGVRKKFFTVKVYVGSLYTERKVATPAQLLADPGEKLIRMNFVYKKVEKKAIVDAFAEGLSNNSPEVARSAEAKAFLSWFTADFVAGDTVDLSLSPDGTVAASHNGKSLGSVRSPALVQGVLLIWFGEKPADGGLKKGMLGQG